MVSISVIVPTYNRALFLPETLTAIITQKVTPDEVIIVDDGSTDDTASVIKRYAPDARHIRIENSGDLAARNVGIRHATSDLIAFCDSDDLWKPDFLVEMVDLWQCEPATKVAFSNFHIVWDDQLDNRTKFDDAPTGYWRDVRDLGSSRGIFEDSVFERLIDFQPFFVSCLVVDREFFVKIGCWDEGVGRVSGDFATLLRMAEHVPFGIIRRPLVGVRKHGTNLSGDLVRMLLGDCAVLEHVLRTRPYALRYAEKIKASIARRRREAFEAAFARLELEEARKLYGLLPAHMRTGRLAVKSLVAGLPMGRPLARLLLGFGTLCSGARNRLRRSKRPLS